MPHVLGFDVAVDVEGKRLPEYKPEVSYDPTLGVPVTTCWIPSEAGKEFCVAVEPPPGPRHSHWSFGMKLDGVSPVVRGTVLFKTSLVPPRLEEQIVSKGIARRFQFATIELTDDDSVLHGASPDLGSIAVLMHSVDDYIASPPMTHYGAVEPAGPVHERAKKAFAHRIGFGEKREFKDSTTWWSPVGKKLQAMVVFKYRNIDILIADDIAPGRKQPAASPVPVQARPTNAVAGPSNPRKRKATNPAVKAELNLGVIEIDSDDEERALETRLAALRAKKAKTGDGVRVKAETNPRLPPFFVPGEVIDLTEDD